MANRNHAADKTTDGRGRRADSPGAIPLKGWKDVLLRVKSELADDHLSLIAAGVTFYALLALFPAIGALVSVYGLLADPATIQEQMQAMAGIVPGGAIQIVEEQLTRMAAQDEGKLGVVFVFGLAVALWSSNKGMKAMFEAMNVAYDEAEERGFVRKNALSLLFTAGALFFAIVTLAFVVVVPGLLGNLGLSETVQWAVSALRWPILFAGIVIGVTLIYRYGPSRRAPRWRWVTWGGVGAAVLWIVASVLFSWYVSNFGSYNETYGSLGAAIGLMTWIWLSTLIILIGAELNAELEHQTTKDSTVGGDQPMGQRNATMADTIGEAR